LPGTGQKNWTGKATMHVKMMRVPAIPMLAILMCASCGADHRRSETGVARDSAGVRILEFSSPEAKWRLADGPSLMIGEVEGDAAYELFNVRTAVRTEDGRIVVANSGTLEIRVFDESGRFLQSIGGPGEGPGEFRSLDWVAWDEDGKIVALDLDERRVTTFAAGGELLSTLDVSTGPGFVEEGDLLLPDGRLLLRWVQTDLFPQVAEGVLHPGQVVTFPAVLTRYDPGTRAMDTVTIMDGGDMAVFETIRGQIAVGGPRFQRLTTYAVGDDGIYVGTQETFEIRKLSFNGDLEEIIRGPEMDLTVTRGVVASYEKARLETASRRVRDDPDLWRQVLKELRTRPLAPTKPAFGRILVGPGRKLWVSEWTIRSVTPRMWTVVDLDTGDVATLVVPERFYVFQVGESFLLGKSTDELGVEFLLVYEFFTEAIH